MAGASSNVVYLSDLLPEDIERLRPIKRVKAEDIIVSPNVPKQFKSLGECKCERALRGTLQCNTFNFGLTAMAPSSNIVRSDVGEFAPSEGSCARRPPRQLLVHLITTRILSGSSSPYQAHEVAGPLSLPCYCCPK